MSTQSITFKIVVAWWLRPYLYTLVVLCALLGTEPNMDRVSVWVSRVVRPVLIGVRRRPWPIRFMRSYIGWRLYLGVWQSICAAWRVSC